MTAWRNRLSSGNWALAAVVGYFCLVALLVCAGPLSGGRVFAFRDLADYALPQKLLVAAELAEGRLPLWNPWNYCGFPLLANLQSGVQYPPNLLYLLLPMAAAVNAWFVGHLLLAAINMTWAARRLGAALPSAALAGAGYGFSGVLLSMTDLQAMLATSAWLPAGVAAGVGLGRRPGARSVVVAALVYGMSFLAGEPQTMVAGGLIAFALSLLSNPRTGRISAGGLLRLLAGWAAAAVLALLLVAPTLLPFVELVGRSGRAGGGLSAEQVFKHSLTPVELPALLMPHYSGRAWGSGRQAGTQLYLRSVFLGVVVWAAVLMAPWRDRRSLLLGAVGLLGLLLALGPSGGLYPWLYEAGFRQSRFPVKFLVLTDFAAAALTALGLDRVRAGLPSGRGLFRLVAVLAVPALFAVHSLLWGAGSGEIAVLRARGALVALLLSLLLMLLGWAVARRRLRPQLAFGALALVLAVETSVAARGQFLTVEPSVLLEPPATVKALRLALASEPTARVYTGPVTQQKLAWVAEAGEKQPAGLVRRRLELLQGNSNLYWPLPVERGGESVVLNHTAGVLELLDRGPQARPLLDLLGIRAMLILGRVQLPGLEPLVEGELSVYRNRQALPRAFVVPRAEAAPDQQEELARLAAPDFDPRSVAVLEAGVAPVRGGPGQVELLHYGPSEIRLQVSAPAGGLLVLTDTWYPGWSAWLGDQQVPLLRVNHAFRGVRVPPGRWLVSQRYRPQSFFAGLLGLALGLIVTALLWWRARLVRTVEKPAPD